MIEVKASAFVGHEQQQYLKKVIDDWRRESGVFGSNFTNQDILDMIFESALEKECAKYGFEG